MITLNHVSNHVLDRVTWLQEHTPLAAIDSEVLTALAASLAERHIEANRPLLQAGEVPEGLYILRQGQLEHQSYFEGARSFLPGSVLGLETLSSGQPVEQTAVTLTPCHLWFVPISQIRLLLDQYPDMVLDVTCKLARDVWRLSSQVSFEQERQAILRPHLVTKARRGVIGHSRYAVRLRNQISKASKTRTSLLIFGEPGLEKDNLAALVHYGSEYRREPMVQLDCSKMQLSGADLFGGVGGKPGILAFLGQGTLVLNNVQELPEPLVPQVSRLAREGIYQPVSHDTEEEGPERYSQARLILLSERTPPDLDGAVQERLKVPPLRVRRADLSNLVDYYIKSTCQQRGIERIQVDPEAIRQLQAYDFPNNLQELQNLVERAIAEMTPGGLLTEEALWPSQGEHKRFRKNLLKVFPRLAQFLRSPWWPTRINYGFTLPFFALLLGVLFLGPQSRDHNVGLNLFWAWWWPLVLLSFPIVGRLWCSVCPFMIYGEVSQKLSQWLFPRQLQRWPRQQAERWGGWFLMAFFALILVWEEVWDLNDTAYLSACLLLLITAGAMIFSVLFERRFWCRYLCPIGGMNGMFAKLSMTELRAERGVCSAECNTGKCYKGSLPTGEGQNLQGCPLACHPAQHEDNRDCSFCMTCLKSCPNYSVEFNLRPPAIELWTTHKPRAYEVALLFLLLGSVYLRRLPELQSQLGLSWSGETQLVRSAVALGILALPAIAPLLAHSVQHLLHYLRWTLKPKPLVQLAYGYLPLVWAANLAHFLRLGLTEAGQILPVTFATMGLSGEGLPIAMVHPAVLAFLQGFTLLFGSIASFWVLRRISRQPLGELWPHCFALILLCGSLWPLIVG